MLSWMIFKRLPSFVAGSEALFGACSRAFSTRDDGVVVKHRRRLRARCWIVGEGSQGRGEARRLHSIRRDHITDILTRRHTPRRTVALSPLRRLLRSIGSKRRTQWRAADDRSTDQVGERSKISHPDFARRASFVDRFRRPTLKPSPRGAFERTTWSAAGDGPAAVARGHDAGGRDVGEGELASTMPRSVDVGKFLA